LAGQGVGLVGEIKPAGQIVRELVEGARQIVSQGLASLVARGRPGLIGGSSPPTASG
jgi:hypothetical protein